MPIRLKDSLSEYGQHVVSLNIYPEDYLYEYFQIAHALQSKGIIWCNFIHKTTQDNEF